MNGPGMITDRKMRIATAVSFGGTGRGFNSQNRGISSQKLLLAASHSLASDVGIIDSFVSCYTKTSPFRTNYTPNLAIDE